MAARTGRRRLWWLAGAAACLLVALGACAALPFFIGWWMDSSDEPKRSDLLMVLCGQEYSRAVYAAELYRKGYAPEVWLARVEVRPPVRLANSLGVKVLNEDEVFEAILLRQGVPRRDLKRYGLGVVSTMGEARAFREEAAPDGKSVLAVTSRYHARRARLVLRRTLPRSEVLVAADPADPGTRRWWTGRDMAKNGLLESAKAVYYLLGGEFTAKDASSP
ncbi:MAG: YdcF family protein [Elusimicrobia bacterium]|nr:YdcF family protein [Elusimicrobiota bacterium]